MFISIVATTLESHFVRWLEIHIITEIHSQIPKLLLKKVVCIQLPIGVVCTTEQISDISALYQKEQ